MNEIDLSYKDEHYSKHYDSDSAIPTHIKIAQSTPAEGILINFVNSKLSDNFDFLQARKRHIGDCKQYNYFKRDLEFSSLEYVLIYHLKNKPWKDKSERTKFLKKYFTFLIFHDEKLIPYIEIKAGLHDLLPDSYYLHPVYSYPNKNDLEPIIAITDYKTNIDAKKTEYLDDIMLFKVSLGDKRFDNYKEAHKELEKEIINLNHVNKKLDFI